MPPLLVQQLQRRAPGLGPCAGGVDASSARRRAGWRKPPAAAAGPGGGNHPVEPQPVMLSGQTLWLQAAGAARPTLFGDSFSLLPPEAASGGGAAAAAPSAPYGLVPWRRPGGLSVRPAGFAAGTTGGALNPANAALVVLPALGETGLVPFSGDPVVLTGGGFIEAEAVEAEVIPPLPALPAPSPGADLPPTTTALATRPPAAAAAGLVPHGLAGAGGEAAGGEGADDAAAARRRPGRGSGGGGEDGDADTVLGDGGVYESFSSSPRRAHKIKFTCRRCGATSIRPINIRVWREGTVFARCGKCRVIHKLIDNLKLFHEMAGPVFDAPSPALDPAAPLPEGLRLNLNELAPGGGGPASVGGFEGFGRWEPRRAAGGDGGDDGAA